MVKIGHSGGQSVRSSMNQNTVHEHSHFTQSMRLSTCDVLYNKALVMSIYTSTTQTQVKGKKVKAVNLYSASLRACARL